MDQPETVTNHRWDGSCPMLQLLDVELGLLGRGHQHRARRVEQCWLFHGEYSAEAQSKMYTQNLERVLFLSAALMYTQYENVKTETVKTHLLSGSASTSSSALQVALESLSEWSSLCLSP